MQLGRWLSIGLILLAAVVARPVQELSTEIPLVTEEAPSLVLSEAVPAPFRCDSARARDCFEMFQRRTGDLSTVASTRTLKRIAAIEPRRAESITCGLKVDDRGEQCLLLRSGR